MLATNLPRRASRYLVVVLLAAVSLLAAGCSNNNNNNPKPADTPSEPAPPPPPPKPYEGYSSALYDGVENWLCRPDIEGNANSCNGDLSATVVYPDGSTELELYTEVDNPPVDCFYVYPTVSRDSTTNSDLEPGIEGAVAFIQVARYRSVCEMYAPLYRQMTATALGNALDGGDIDYQGALDTAYVDVLDAFKSFITNGSGRGFILLGHSQGSLHLIRLIQEEIESQPWLADRMIAAHIIGMLVELPLEGEVGATFESTPPCTFDQETGCVVNFSSFSAANPPTPEAGFFGISNTADRRSACTNPVDLGGGRLNLEGYYSPFQVVPFNDPERNAAITTAFFKLPGLVQGECIEEGAKGYLAISLDADPDDPRIDSLGNEGRGGWGLHALDMALAQGDLVRLAQRQADAWLDQ